MLSHLSCVRLFETHGSSVRGILQARILEWVAMPFPRESSQPRDRTCVSYVSYTDGQVLYQYFNCQVILGSLLSLSAGLAVL